jgi:hypothetical protein
MTENGEYKISIEQRITRLETQLEEVIENHLPHIESKVDRITWLLVTTLVGIVLLLLKLNT